MIRLSRHGAMAVFIVVTFAGVISALIGTFISILLRSLKWKFAITADVHPCYHNIRQRINK